jgi:hypothetical protein
VNHPRIEYIITISIRIERNAPVPPEVISPELKSVIIE